MARDHRSPPPTAGEYDRLVIATSVYPAEDEPEYVLHQISGAEIKFIHTGEFHLNSYGIKFYLSVAIIERTMYLNIDVTQILPTADKFIMDNDRALYVPFFKTAEVFCADNGVLIGGNLAVDLLAGDTTLRRDSFVWELYADDTLITARRFADKLAATTAPHVPIRTISMQTNIKNREFTIFIDARMLFKITGMDRFRGVNLIEAIKPPVVESVFGTAIKRLSDELLLIDIYRKLYSPVYVSDWPAVFRSEKIIYEHLSANTGRKSGGSNLATTVASIKSKINLSDAVIIGDYALGRENGRLQVIGDINTVMKHLPAKNGVVYTYEMHSLHIPSDFQIRKYIVYGGDNREKTPILEVFNSTEFEIIPYEEIDGKRVGTPWVLLRFIFIDIWSLTIITKLTGKNMNNRINMLLASVVHLRERAHDYFTTSSTIPPYSGVYISDTVAKKKLIRDIGARFPTYYPARAIDKAKTGGNDGSPIDLYIDYANKSKILRKIAGIKWVGDRAQIDAALNKISGSPPTSKWGTNKTIEKFFYKNAFFIPFIGEYCADSPPIVVADIGCGDGIDSLAIASKYRVSRTIAADIEDTRTDKSSEFVRITIDEPLGIGAKSADIVLVFHCIHHMREDIARRLGDIVRIARDGGLILIKDHDVRDDIDASNVDFEHLVYLLPGRNVAETVADFRNIEPMTYYPREHIHSIMIAAGCELVASEIIGAATRIYASVFRKKEDN